MYYYRQRYYSTEWMRFTREDPIEFDGGANLFAYVEGDPLSRIDPTGEAGLVGPAVGTALTVYGLSKMFSAQTSCEKTCDLTHGEVQACGDPERQDMLDAQKNQRVLACKASCAMSSIISRLLPGRLK
jgi:uncharacterized protein RhaS with RHS repeats